MIYNKLRISRMNLFYECYQITVTICVFPKSYDFSE